MPDAFGFLQTLSFQKDVEHLVFLVLQFHPDHNQQVVNVHLHLVFLPDELNQQHQVQRQQQVKHRVQEVLKQEQTLEGLVETVETFSLLF
jgi:acid stress-induced BolA-like protein IbaG/YrbA